MSDDTEEPSQQQEVAPSETPSSTVTSTIAMVDTVPPKYPNVSFSIWPPRERTRDAVKNRLIETLSTPSILSKRYGTMSSEDAMEAAKIIEEEAFQTAETTATTDGDGIEILQVYSREISRRMLDTMKAKSGTQSPNLNKDQPKVDDAESTAPPQSEKTEATG
ncbi:WPP domain-containing protein 2 [Abeliophyllum distichum]|uniref:WPP domain-containing protein 2 n=1 Tax=Abeliophyllum distichum TaxID=126358 RepID=A0ABD1SUB0_9LAMI